MTPRYATPAAEMKGRLVRGRCFIRLEPHGPVYAVITVGDDGWIKVRPEEGVTEEGNWPFWLNLALVREISIRSEP
jgi:hypothetical protein